MSTSRELELEQEVKRLRQENAWFHALMRNDTIPPQIKVSFYETKYEYIHSEKDVNGYARIFVWKVAEGTGICRKTVGKHLQTLADHGVIDRKVDYVEGSQGEEKAIFVKLNDVARTPGRIEFPESKRGGKRIPRCEACGHDTFVEKIQRICTCCGTVQESWRTIEPKKEEDINEEREEI